MKKFKENNKGFSLVELIVVIAIMVVLIAVLGSTILGYVEKSKYSKDVTALDSIKTAVSTYVADPDNNYQDDTTYRLSTLMTEEHDPNGVIAGVLNEVFDGDAFQGTSKAFKNIETDDVLVMISGGAVSIKVPAAEDYDDYVVGGGDDLAAPSAGGSGGSGDGGSGDE